MHKHVLLIVMAGALQGLRPCLAETAAAAGSPPGTTNLVANGAFEIADPERPGCPLGWDRPDGLGIQWTNAPAGADGVDRGKAVRMDTRVSERDMEARWRQEGLEQWHIPNAAANPIAATYGLSLYSVPVVATTNQSYRIAFDVLAPGGGAKVWVRGYAPTADGTLRRCYETVVHCRPKPSEWHHEERVFTPAKSGADIRELRVMLYAYWPAGLYWFDNVRLEPVPVVATGAEQPQTAGVEAASAVLPCANPCAAAR